jgi:hypothetical protein
MIIEIDLLRKEGRNLDEVNLCSMGDFAIIGFNFWMLRNQQTHTGWNWSTHFHDNRIYGPPYASDS